ncbi:MAG: LytR C-terminal domain-containing protein [Ilumatobacteraceae bacterium]
MSQQKPGAKRPSLSSPSTGTLGAAVAVVALVLGFLILRDVRGDGGAATVPVGTADPSGVTVAPGGSVDPAAPTTLAPFSINGFKIQVANASGLAGSAGDMTTKLQDQGYVVQVAMNVAAGTAKRAKTGVFYLAGCEAASQNVAAVLGGNVEVAAMPQPIPVETGSVGEACILVLLGTDLANKPLAGVVGGGSGAAATTTTTVAG